MAPPKRSNLTLIMGIAAIILLAILLFAFLTSLRPDTVKALVPKEDIGAFQPVTEDSFDYADVPTNSPELEGLATEATLEGAKEKATAEEQREGIWLFSTQTLPKGKIFYADNLTNNSDAGCAIVSPDERVIAVTTTLPGGVAGAVRSGSVVDVSTPGSELGGSATYSKVLAVGSTEGINGDICGVPASAPPGDGNNPGRSDGVIMALAVEAAQAQGISGQEVVITLNPFCTVKPTKRYGGIIVPVSPEAAAGCAPSSSRIAGRQPVVEDAGGETAPPGTTTDAEPTTTDPATDPTTTDPASPGETSPTPGEESAPGGKKNP